MPTTTVFKPCAETDAGLDEYNKGTTSRGMESISDRCANTAQLVEYYCINNRISSKRIECPKGCTDGRCEGCVDTDGGDNPDVYGEVTIGDTLRKKDICSNIGDEDNILREFYCVSPTELSSREVVCPGTCSAGRCA